MRHKCDLAVIATLIGLTGCETKPFADSSWPEARPLGRHMEAYRPEAQPPSGEDVLAPPPPDPSGSLTLRDAIASALLGNPELARFGYDVRAAEARVVQAGLWENPELDIEIENFAGSGGFDGTDAAEVTLMLSQTFPLGGDIERRQELARLHGQLAGWDYEATRVALLAEVTQRYVDVLVAQQRIDLAQESLDLAVQIANSIDRRVEAGDAPAVERSRAAVPVATARIELDRAMRDLETTHVRLALTWGSSTPQFEEVQGDLEQVMPIPAASELTVLISQNPEVARWAVEIASRQAEVELTRAEAKPDLTAGLGYRWFNESDDNALVAGFSIPFPVFDRRQGDILAARFGVASAHNQQQAIELKVTAALASTYARLVNAHDEAVALRDHAIPPSEAAYRDIRQAYDGGNLGYLDVLDAERTLIDLRRKYLDALAEYHSAAAELEGLIGQSLDSIDHQAKPELQETQPTEAE